MGRAEMRGDCRRHGRGPRRSVLSETHERRRERVGVPHKIPSTPARTHTAPTADRAHGPGQSVTQARAVSLPGDPAPGAPLGGDKAGESAASPLCAPPSGEKEARRVSCIFTAPTGVQGKGAGGRETLMAPRSPRSRGPLPTAPPPPGPARPSSPSPQHAWGHPDIRPLHTAGPRGNPTSLGSVSEEGV